MNCDQVRDHLLGGGPTEAPELQEHTAQCAMCRELVGAQGVVEAFRAEPPADFGGLEALRSQLGAELAQDEGAARRLKSLPTLTRLLVALGLACTLVLLEGLVLARVDLHLVPMGQLLLTFLGLGVLAGVGFWAALRPLYRQALPASTELLLLALCLLVPVALSFLQPETGHPAALKGVGPSWLKYVALCFGHGLTAASLLWLGLRLLDRQSFATSFAPLAAGGATAVVAVLGLQIHCPIPDATHWLLGHAAVGLVLVGVLLARKKLS